MLILLFITAIFIGFLIFENISLNKSRASIPLRISVTGTRGKSTVVRLLASILREHGKSVLAKTTGTLAQYILRDGTTENIRRRGRVSIIEQKHLLRKAALQHADCIVAEIMSIAPENHWIESQKILQPHIVIITNTRRDHIDAMGETEDDIAEVLSLDISSNSSVFIPENEHRKSFDDAISDSHAQLFSVRNGLTYEMLSQFSETEHKPYFTETIDLVCGVAQWLNIPTEVIARGISNADPDPGQLAVWQYHDETAQKKCFLVSAFAANDPQSSASLIHKVQQNLGVSPRQTVALLHLRTDRGDRSLQWLHALRNGMADLFAKIYTVGGHSRVIGRKIRSAQMLPVNQPQGIMKTIMAEIEDGSVLLGLGNYVGLGKKLTDYWNKTGTPYGL